MDAKILGESHIPVGSLSVRAEGTKRHLGCGAAEGHIDAHIPCGTVIAAGDLVKDTAQPKSGKSAVVYQHEGGEHIATSVSWENYSDMLHRLRVGARITWGGDQTDEVTADKLLRAALGDNWQDDEALKGVRVGAELRVVLSAMLYEAAINPQEAKTILAHVAKVHTGDTPWRKRELTAAEKASEQELAGVVKHIDSAMLKRWSVVRTRSIAFRELQRIMGNELRRRSQERAAKINK